MTNFIVSRFDYNDMNIIEKLFFVIPLMLAISHIIGNFKHRINYKLIIYLILLSGFSRFAQPIYRSLVFASVSLPGLFAYRMENNKSTRNQNWEKLHKKYSKKTLNVIKKLKGIYYKVGQIFGSRGDISPEIYQKELACLLDNVPYESYSKIKKKVSYLLPLLDSFDKIPISSASIGQVHKAKYQDKDVVVKILYPNIETQTKSDLFVLKLWTKYALPSIKDSVDGFVDITLNEFDFRRESEVYQIMKEGIRIDNVYVPKVYQDLTTKDVLVLEYINGISLLEYIYKSDYQSNLKIIKKIIEVTIKQIYQLGVFSTDPHPGNFLVVENENQEPILVPLDFGQTARFNSEEKECFKYMMIAIANQNEEQINYALNKAGFKSKFNNQTFKTFFVNSMFDTRVPTSLDLLGDFEYNNSLDEWSSIPIRFNLVSKTITTLSGICSLAKIYDLSIAEEFVKLL